MENYANLKKYELLCVIVNFGLGSKVIKLAKKSGVTGGTIFLGNGTVNSNLLKLLDLTDIRKEIILMISQPSLILDAVDVLDKHFKFKKPNHGIAFTTPVANLLGSRESETQVKESEGEITIMYNAIFTVVDKGKSESVIDAAVLAGSKGGTIINARGSGIHETSMLFSMAIEPEKEVVMIISEKQLTDSIVSSIRDHLKIDEPGKGIMFILDVNKTYGLI